MRVKTEILEFLKQKIRAVLPESKVYLFGSRADDTKKGGDIDILVLANRELSFEEKRNIKIAFWKEFGEQKIDLASFTFESEVPFKQLALLEGVEI